MDKIEILLVIPCYRCERQISRVLSELSKNRNQLPEIKKVLVLDNQSPDKTVDVANQHILLAQIEDWAEVQVNSSNLGLGGTHKAAFALALAQNYSHIIIFHGDDQGDTNEIPMIISQLKKGYDAVLGSRFMKNSRRLGYSKLRTFGNRILNIAYTILTGTKVLDLGSGLNGFKLSALANLQYQTYSNQFTFNMDLLLNIIENHCRLCFVPISWREVDQISNAKSFNVGWQALRTLLVWRIRTSPSKEV